MIRDILMDRDDISAEEADELISNAREDLNQRLADGDITGAYKVCEDWFGLEPDCIEELVSDR